MQEQPTESAPDGDATPRYYRVWYGVGPGESTETVVRHRGAPLDVDVAADRDHLIRHFQASGLACDAVVAVIECDADYVQWFWTRVLGQSGQCVFEISGEVASAGVNAGR